MVICEKKEKHIQAGEDRTQIGSQYTHIALDPETRLEIAHVVGKRNQETMDELLRLTLERSTYPSNKDLCGWTLRLYQLLDWLGLYDGQKILYLSDGDDRVTKGLEEIYAAIDYLYAQVIKHRQGNRVAWVERVVIHGWEKEVLEMIAHCDHSQTINTAFIERYNLTQRHLGTKSSRKKLSFAKKLPMLKYQEDITGVYYNFVRPHMTLSEQHGCEVTPALQARITDHVWTWEEVLAYDLAFN